MSCAQVYREALEAAAKCCEDRMSTYSRGSEVRRAMCEQMAKEIRSLPIPSAGKANPAHDEAGEREKIRRRVKVEYLDGIKWGDEEHATINAIMALYDALKGLPR